ncbi:conserved hypothetical protein [Ricinus communis]|uniref:Plant thionin family protein n=1 Tax=Ricinus communis TaxID=3988 RepID=B9SQH7_RICCO|nr:conserved hypothetical protein [Ricinus communis]
MSPSKISIATILIIMLVASTEVAEGWKLGSYTTPTIDADEACFNPCFASCIPHKPKFLCKPECVTKCSNKQS